jgi:hypothetical protein
MIYLTFRLVEDPDRRAERNQQRDVSEVVGAAHPDPSGTLETAGAARIAGAVDPARGRVTIDLAGEVAQPEGVAALEAIRFKRSQRLLAVIDAAQGRDVGRSEIDREPVDLPPELILLDPAGSLVYLDTERHARDPGATGTKPTDAPG